MVALLAEGVDRNPSEDFYLNVTGVALLAEGVDRNECNGDVGQLALRVALLAEGVDRNFICQLFGILFVSRPPRGGRG